MTQASIKLVMETTAETRIWRVAWVAAAVAIIAIQLGLTTNDSGQGWALQVGIAMLALLCAVRTALHAPVEIAAYRWRWLAASFGMLAWSLQWTANAFFQSLLAGDYTLPSLFVAAVRGSIVVALMPITTVEDRPLLRVLDVAQGAVFAALLTLLSWPGLIDGSGGGPDIRYLYLGYGAMVAAALFSLIAEHSLPARRLIVATLAAQLLYGAGGIVGTEVLVRKLLEPEYVVLIFADAAFLAYLILIGRPKALPQANDMFENSILPPRIVPVVLMALSITLAFAMTPLTGTLSTGAGILALALYAARNWITEHRFRQEQRIVLSVAKRRIDKLADLIHEIRSPLGLISLNAGLIIRRRASGMDTDNLATTIQSRCAAITHMLDDMLDLERLEAGLVSVASDLCELKALVDEELDAAQSLASQRRIRLIYPSVGCAAFADRLAISRIIANLVNNALRFTPAGGLLSVTIDRRKSAICIDIADTGVGLSDVARSELFSRFSAPGIPVHGRPGSGLGLSISRALARAMHGDLALLETSSSGTVFRLTLPPVAGS